MDEWELTEERKKQIDALDRYEMCKIWRFADTGNWMVMGACGSYFKDRLFNTLGGFSPAISKSLGHG